MAKIKEILKSGRVIVLIVFLILGVVALYPQPWADGVAIKSVARNSSAAIAGMVSPKANLAPTAHERITAVNNRVVSTIDDYYKLVEDIEPNKTVRIKTNQGSYSIRTEAKVNRTVLNETETILVNKTIQVNQTNNETNKTELVNKTVEVEEERPIVVEEVIGVEPLGIGISEAATSNLRKGLDLQGGTRVVLKPQGEVTAEVIQDTIDTLEQRLNVYGLSDVSITQVSDNILGGGNTYILVEIAGITPEDVETLIGSQGKFEAQVANQTVFSGGDKDITYVCRTSQCSGIDPRQGCSGDINTGFSCPTFFQITLSPQAANRWAEITKDIPVVGETLADEIVLYLDDVEVDRLSISRGLRGQATTDIQISGGGAGQTYDAAIEDALNNMKRMQTILKTGSLPVKLEIESIDEISPTLGSEFLKNAFFVGLLSLLAVTVVLVTRYRRLQIAVPILITALSEIFLTLGIAALIGWNIDLAAVAGIILAVGTGVNDQIIITDEAIGRKGEEKLHWKTRIKRAFFIIMSAYFTTSVAMIPLFFAGAGLLKGFALTTILAITVGVFITRPAYAAIIQHLVEE